MATAEKIDYLSQAADAADKVYPKIVALACTHKSGAKTYAQLVSSKQVTCASSASITYQRAGILPSGKLVNHLDAVGASASYSTTAITCYALVACIDWDNGL